MGIMCILNTINQLTKSQWRMETLVKKITLLEYQMRTWWRVHLSNPDIHSVLHKKFTSPLDFNFFGHSNHKTKINFANSLLYKRIETQIHTMDGFPSPFSWSPEMFWMFCSCHSVWIIVTLPYLMIECRSTWTNSGVILKTIIDDRVVSIVGSTSVWNVFPGNGQITGTKTFIYGGARTYLKGI